MSVRLVKQLATWTTLLLSFGAGVELAARVDDHLTYGAPLWSRYDAELLRQDDEDGIPHHLPGARFEKWRINALGFRGPELPRLKAPGRRRIVCLGQSESFGLYERADGEWPALLGRRLEDLDPDVEVLNASVVGMSRWNRRAYIERYVLPIGPDVLVIVPNGYLEAAVTLLGRPPVRSAAPGAPPSSWTLPRPRALAKLKLKAKELLPVSLVSAIQERSLARSLRQVERERLGGRALLEALPPGYEARYEAHLRDLVAMLRSRGVQPVLATYPTFVHSENLERHREILVAQRVYYVEFSEVGLLDVAQRLNVASRRVARELDVPLADLDRSVPRDAGHFVDQVHYTDAGAAAVASDVLATLRLAGLAGRAGPSAGAASGPGKPARTAGWSTTEGAVP